MVADQDRVTVGIPVYNGGTLIVECLKCVTSQSHRNLEILVLDNASTDDTQRVVEDIAATDPRIIYRRQASNVGLMRNFLGVMEQATSPYFLWLGHDDLWSPNYIEELLNALQSTSGAKLAVGTVETYRGGNLLRTVRPPHLSNSNDKPSVRDLLFKSHQAWFCGLWNLEAVKPVVRRVWAEYPSPWGPDHLTLYPFLLDRTIAFAPSAIFIQRLTIKGQDNSHRRDPLSVLIDLRRRFWKLCQDFLDERSIFGLRRLTLNGLTWLYVGKRVYSIRKMAKRILRDTFKPKN